MVALTIALVAITRRYVRLTAEIIKESQIESSACFRDFASCPQPHLPTQRECTVLFNAPQKEHVHCISILMYNGDTQKWSSQSNSTRLTMDLVRWMGF
jgi:hypothetical protein